MPLATNLSTSSKLLHSCPNSYVLGNPEALKNLRSQFLSLEIP